MLKPGFLRIGTYFENPPFEFVSGEERVGFEVDLMKEVSQRLGLRSEFVNTRGESSSPRCSKSLRLYHGRHHHHTEPPKITRLVDSVPHDDAIPAGLYREIAGEYYG